jgi:glyoxylase-like metal-dependent hydrolase (beta-lactamase superfamily II)
MRYLIAFATICGASLAASSAPRRTALDAAAEALGVRAIRTLQFTASGATFSVGQNFSPTDPWPRVTLKRYTALIDYEHASIQQDLVREMGATMPRGGGVPFTGELRQIQASDSRVAWNLPMTADPSAGSLPLGPCTPPEAGGTGPRPAAAPDSVTACDLMIWTTPAGFLKAAIANHATTREGEDGTTVSFRLASRHRIEGLIDRQHHVTRVHTWIDQSIVGDMPVETEYSGYRDFGGVSFPERILQKQDGFPSMELVVSAVTVNPPAAISPPPEASSASAMSSTSVMSQEVADGVFWLAGGTHHSLAIAMRDHIILVDTPNGEARALAVIAKAKALLPGKPVRYVVVTHHHWDHMGGIRAAIDAGATIVTHAANRALLERAATAPHTIHPDRLSQSKQPLKLEVVDAEHTLTDGSRTVKLYTMSGFDHTAGMLLVYLPNEKVLAEADAYSPPDAPTTPLIAPKVPYAAALYDNIHRLKLDVRTIVPFHGMRTANMTELARQAGR